MAKNKSKKDKKSMDFIKSLYTPKKEPMSRYGSKEDLAYQKSQTSHYGSKEDLAFQKQQKQDLVKQKLIEQKKQAPSEMPTKPTVPAPAPAPIVTPAAPIQAQPAAPTAMQQAPVEAAPAPIVEQPQTAGPVLQQPGQQPLAPPVEQPIVKPQENPNELENLPLEEVEYSKQSIQQEIQQPNNFSIAGTLDSGKDIFDAVGGKKIYDYAKNNFLDPVTNTKDKLMKLGIPILGKAFDHLTSNSSVASSSKLPEKYSGNQKLDKNSVPYVVQGEGDAFKGYTTAIEDYDDYVDEVKIKVQKDGKKFSKQREKLYKENYDLYQKVKDQKEEEEFQSKQKTAEALQISLEQKYLDKNQITIMKQNIMKLQKKRNNIINQSMDPAKKESLIHGSSFSSALFKTASMLLTGPIHDVYGKDPAKIIAEDAEEKFQTKLAENKDLYSAYATLGKALNSERLALNDYMTNSLTMIQKRVEYAAKYKDSSYKIKSDALAKGIDLYKSTLEKEQNKKDVSNQKMILEAKSKSLDHKKNAAVQEASRLEKNVEQKNLQMKQITDQSNFLKEQELKQKQYESENTQINNENKRADKQQDINKGEFKDTLKFKKSTEKGKITHKKDTLSYKKDVQSDKNRQHRQNLAHKKAQETNKFTNKTLDRNFKKNKVAAQIAFKQSAIYQKAQNQKQRDLLLQKFKASQNALSRKHKSSESLKSRTSQEFKSMTPTQKVISKFKNSYKVLSNSKDKKQITQLNPRDNKEILKTVDTLKNMQDSKFNNLSSQGAKEVRKIDKMIEQATLAGRGLNPAEMKEIKKFNNKYGNSQGSPLNERLQDAKKVGKGSDNLTQEKFNYKKQRDIIKDKRYDDKVVLAEKTKLEKKTASDKKITLKKAESLKKRTMILPNNGGKVYTKLDDAKSIQRGIELTKNLQDFQETKKDFTDMIKYSKSVAGPIKAFTKGLQSLAPTSAAANEKALYKNKLIKLVGKFRVHLTGGGVSSDRDMRQVQKYLKLGKLDTIFASKAHTNKFIELFDNYGKKTINDVRNIFEDGDSRQEMILKIQFEINEVKKQMQNYGFTQQKG